VSAIGRIRAVHDREHWNALAQERNRDRRAAPPLDELARAVLRIDEPARSGKRPGGQAGFFAEKSQGTSACRRSHSCSSISTSMGALPRDPRGPACAVELCVQALALVFYDRDDLKKAVARSSRI
jgi:hypothetical protein